MPIYEYACEVCGHEFEKLTRIGAEAPPCPVCAGDVRKLVSATSFVLKGSGWYKDHYGLKSGGKSDSAADAKSTGGDKGAKKDSGTTKTSDSTASATAAA